MDLRHTPGIAINKFYFDISIDFFLYVFCKFFDKYWDVDFFFPHFQFQLFILILKNSDKTKSRGMD